MRRYLLIQTVISTVMLITQVMASDRGILDTNYKSFNQMEISDIQTESRINLSLVMAIEFALKQNPNLLAVREGIGLAEARSATARQNTLNPQLEFEYEGDNFTDDLGVRDIQLGLTLNFELRGQRGWRKQIGKSGELSAVQRLKQAEWNLRSKVKVAFYGIQFLKQNIELATKRLEVTQRLLEVAEARLKNQQIPEIQVNFVRIEFFQASNAYERIAGQLPIEQSKFARLLGFPIETQFDFEGKFEPSKVAYNDDSTVSKRAIASRGDLAALRAELKGAEARVRLEKSLIWPGAEVGLFVRQVDDLAGVFGMQQIKRDKFFGIQLSLPLPILSWRSGQIREAEAEVRIISAKLKAFSREILIEVSEVAKLVRVLRGILDVYNTKLSILSEQNLIDIERAFVVGEVGTTEVLRAQDDFVDVTQDYYKILYEYLEAEAKLEAIIGPPLSDFKSAINNSEGN